MDQKRDLLIGVGVGPGDPELVTLKAIRVLRQAGTILVPESVQKPAPGRAEATVLAHLPAGRRCRIRRVAFPMVAEGPGPAAAAAQATAWAEAAQIVVEALEAGAGPVAFATIGDPSVYSTFSYLAQAVVARHPAATVQVIPGITAMQDLAARTAVPLCCGNQALTLVPATAGLDAVRAALRSSATVVTYKAGLHMPDLLTVLAEEDRLEHTVVGQSLGLHDERCLPAAQFDPAEPAGYLTTLLTTARPDAPMLERLVAGQNVTVWFVGAGPGAADLVTIRGAEVIRQADVVLWASSLVHRDILKHAKPGASIVDSAVLSLEDLAEVFRSAAAAGLVVARVHTGDPALWSAVQEQRDICDALKITHRTVPGVTAVSAVAALLDRELTAPEIAQSLVLTRLEGGKTPMPPSERVREFATHQTTMALYLSVARSARLQEELLAGGYPPDTPCVIAHAATWPEELVVHCTVADLAATCKRHRLWKHTLVLVGRALAAERTRSHLYHPGRFTTYRRADPVIRKHLVAPE